MRLSVLHISALALLASAPVAFSNPRISIGDPPTGVPVGSTFGFNSDSRGGGFFTFTNESGVDWTSLDLFVTEPTSVSIACSTDAFDLCEVGITATVGSNSTFDIGFDGVTSHTGIPNGTSFMVDLNNTGDNVDGTGDWGPNVHFEAEAQPATTAAPEPSSTAALAGVGLSAVLTAYWRKRNR